MPPALAVRAERPAPVRGTNLAGYTPDTPEVLLTLERIRSGDRRALDELFGQHQSFLLSLVRCRLRKVVANRLDAADVVQDVQLEVFSRLQDYLRRYPMPFRIWLRRTVLERLQKTHRFHLGVARRTVVRERRSQPVNQEADGRHRRLRFCGPLEAAAYRELADRIQNELRRLPAADQEIVQLRVQQGHSNAEAAVWLGIPAETAKKRYSRALRRLRDRLPQAGWE